MSSNAGGSWTASQDSASQARMNAKTLTIDTGTHLSVISPTYPGQLVFSLDNTGSFVANFLYERNAANTAWLQISPPGAHTHSNSLTGGLLSAILNANNGQYLSYAFFSPTKAQFLQTIGGTATISDVQGAGSWYVQIATGTVANNLGQIDMGGLALDFGNVIKFNAKVGETGGTTSIQGRMGVNIETVGAAISNTTKSLGMEFCDSTGSAYQVVSCDGTTRTVTTTNQPFAGNNDVRFLYTPTLNVVGTVNQTVATTKGSNLPNSGAVANDRIARFGIQSTNTVSKNLQLYGGMVTGIPNDTFYV
jgi:hypothetical protein